MEVEIGCPEDGCMIKTASPSDKYRFFTVLEKEKENLNPPSGFLETKIQCNDCNSPPARSSPHKFTVYWYK